MKGLDNNEEAKNLVENFKGSTENRMRSLYNLGYWQGFNDGQREAVQMLERALMDMTAEQTEPKKTTDYCDDCNHKGCDNCIADSRDDYCIPSNYQKQTEPQTEREDE